MTDGADGADGPGYGGDVSLARAERAALSDTLDRTDPDRPTLCDGWTARDLLAHLLVRERQPWASVGMFVPALSGVTDQAMRSYADTPWPELVDELRSGPARLVAHPHRRRSTRP